MKKLLAMVLAVLMVLTMFAGCAKTEAPADAGKTDAGKTETQQPGGSGKTEEEKPFEVPYDDWSDKTDEELYEAAKKEGGTINVYTISSRMQKTVKSFMETYPELKAEAIDLDQDEAVAKIKIEAESGNINADVLQCKDTAGEIFYDFFPLGYVETYYPRDICSHIDINLMRYGMPFYGSLNFWYYNTAAFPNGSPVTNWWDIIEMKDGKQVYNLVTKEIGAETTYLALFASFILNADEMAAAYKEKYGKDIEYTYDASTFGTEPNNAGWEYLYRFTQMKMSFISDGDEITAAVHNSTAEAPTLGLASAGKLSNREDNGYTVDWVQNVKPFTAVQNTSYLYVVKGCDNQAGARLFIRYLMGGADGQGEGFDPFTKQGNWSIRDDYTNPNNPFSLKESGAITTNIKDVYDIILDVSDFWSFFLDKNPNM